MQMNYVIGGDGVGYARKESYEYEGKIYEADLQDGDKVTIKDAGVVETHPQYGEQSKFIVETRNGDKRTGFNQSTINVLIEAFSKDSEQWKGKEVTVLTRKAMIAGEKRVIAYFVVEGWYLDEYGDLCKKEDRKAVEQAEIKDVPKKADYPESLPASPF